MSQYGPGTTLTCDVTNGQLGVNFSASTTLLTEGIAANHWFSLDDTQSDIIKVSSVDSETSLTLENVWTGDTATGQFFVIVTDFTARMGYPIFNQGDKRAGKMLARLVNMLDTDMVRFLIDTDCSNPGSYSGSYGDVTIDTPPDKIGKALYHNGTNYQEANATTSSTMPCTALTLETGVGATKVLFWGFLSGTVAAPWEWTPGAKLYVDTVSGDLKESPPNAGSGTQVQIVGIAIAPNKIFFNPSYVLVERV